MPAGGVPLSLEGTLTLRQIREFLRRSHLRALAAFIAVGYALGSMLWGGMLTYPGLPGGTTIELLTGSGTGTGWWNYPGLLVVAPWGVLSLPFFPTVAMIAVSIGVGLGMAVAVGLIIRLIRPSPAELARSKAVGAVTGLTPAMISLVTLGSCCTTTAVATGGVGLLAQASGASTSDLLLNNWYLGAAQVAIVWAALVGQELLLGVYGGLFGLGRPGSSFPVEAPPVDLRWLGGAALRGALALGGLFWSLSMLAQWTVQPPLSAGPGWWAGWVVQHQLIAALAVGAAVHPTGLDRVARRWRNGWGRLGRLVVGAAAVSLLAWLPAPLPAWGLDSFGSELAGFLGAPAAWGGISVGAVTGIALLARWAFEYVLLGAFALGVALSPERALAPLLATVARSGAPKASGARTWNVSDASSGAHGPTDLGRSGAGSPEIP